MKKFRQRGWAVGARAGSDLCAACITKNRLARKAPAAVEVVKIPEPPAPTEQPALPKHEGVILPDLTQKTPERLYTVLEAAKLGIASKPTIHRYIFDGRMPVAATVNGMYMVTEEDLVQTFKNMRKSPKPYGRKPSVKKSVNEPTAQINDGVSTMNDQSAPTPTPAMTKEDRRIIFSEIDSHYLDEKRGYAKDWDDEKVSTGLKVSVEWVRSIREDNFGPEKGDGIDEEVEKLRVASAEAQKVIDTMRALWKEMDATLATYEEKQTELSEEANKVSKVIAQAKAAIDAATRK
jgi:hypothetical protein